ncbi:MAG TPA: hypothetical protein VFG11_04290, partial [Acidobacteriota bacterium]|nr:hypothetical protein [Acidobacteriota bacterium]
VPPTDYRWLSSLISCVVFQTLPTSSTSVIPKILAGLFFAAFSTLLFRLWVHWSVPTVIAVLAPLVIIFHPIVNEITLWNGTATFSLWLGCCLAAYLLIEKDRPKWQQFVGLTLLVLVVLAYEIYLVTFLVLILAEPMIKAVSGQPILWLEIKRKLTIFAVVAVFYVLQVVITRWMFGAPGSRGFVAPLSFSGYLFEKVHGAFNLIVNCYMPLVSYYQGLEVAWSAWKWIPISIAGATLVFGFLARRSYWEALRLAGFSLLVPVVPTLPIFLASQSPESWRVSIPVLLAVCLTIVLLTTLIWNAVRKVHSRILILQNHILALTALVAIFAIEVPITFAEARLRVFENHADRTLMQAVGGFWEAKGLKQDQYRVGVISDLSLTRYIPTEYVRAARISVAYGKRGLSSDFDHDFSWRGLLMLNGYRVVELDDGIASVVTRCEERPEFCRLDLRDELLRRCANMPNYIHRLNGFRLVHDIEDRITAICQPG